MLGSRGTVLLLLFEILMLFLIVREGKKEFSDQILTDF